MLKKLDMKDKQGRAIAGRLMDELILRQVVTPLLEEKPEFKKLRTWAHDARDEGGAPFYSTSVDDALDVVELMLSKQALAVLFYQNVRKLLDAAKEDCALVKLFTHDRPAEAICLAGLLAVKGIPVNV
jgi:hypothetical protein